MAIQYPPFAAWTENNHSGAVIIVTTLCMFYWLIPGVMQQAIFLARDLRFTYTGAMFILSMASGTALDKLAARILLIRIVGLWSPTVDTRLGRLSLWLRPTSDYSSTG
jgi:hypothetical protein